MSRLMVQSNMAEAEGVIKYQLNFQEADAIKEDLQQLNVWRSILHGLGLIGQDPQRYQGFGYGNISQRSGLDPAHFIISGTQTGQLLKLSQAQYVLIQNCDIENNQVSAKGPIKPSSEALTHATLYQLNPVIQCVMHVHDPVLWRFGLAQGIPATDEKVAYGTPAMAQEMTRLYRDTDLSQHKILVMAGHEDGVLSFGDSIDEAGNAMLRLWLDAHR